MQANTHEQVYLRDYTVPHFLIDKVNLEFDLNEDFTKVKSELHIRKNQESKDASHDLTLFGENLELKSISLDGKILDLLQYRINTGSLIVYGVPDKFVLEIVTLIKPQENTELNGLYKSSGNYCTQCEAEGFRRITYYIDRPDVMAKYTTTIVAEESRYPILLSNGNLIDSGKLENGKHWAKWEDPFKKPSYLFALVAGNLEFIEDIFVTKSGRNVVVKIFVEKGNRDKCLHAMQAVKKAMRWDEEKYGREYDLDIYMIVAVSDFNMGAMENKGLNIFNTKYILAKPGTATDDDFLHVESVIAHEYFHNWTGNRITCREWFQLSLKEGLTVFRDQCFTADTTSKTVARIQAVNELRNAQFVEDAGPLAHPVIPESYLEINNFYTSTIYNKGAEVIRMMQTILGEALFRKGMDLYFERHDGQAVTIEEFVKAMEDASKIDLQQFRLWYHQAGTPVLEIKDNYDATNKIYQIHIKQYTPATTGQTDKKALHIPIQIGLLNNSGKEFINDLLQLKNAEETFKFDNVSSKPVLSVLRYFSAPVKVKYDYSDEELALLYKYDNDQFNQWEAGQTFATNQVLNLITLYKNKQTLKVDKLFIDAFKFNLLNIKNDKLFLATLLTLPSERYIAEQMKVIDVDAIHTAREFLLVEIANNTKDDLLKIYLQNHHLAHPYQFDMEDMGDRSLRNVCLSYLGKLPEQKYRDICIRQFKNAMTLNMTDTVAALKTLSHIDCHEREPAFESFYTKWRHDPLVVNKWFSLQAESSLPGIIKHVKQLLNHPAFDIKNPNNVYALLAAFTYRNLVRFHAENGEGYELLACTVLKLDALNPNVAARMVKPLTEWQRFDDHRQQLMRTQLEALLARKELSKDVYELVSKSLQINETEETV